MIYVAGKPIIGHILDNLKGLFKDVVLIVGYMKDKLIDYVDKNYSDIFNIQYVEQKEILGLGHAIYLGKDAIGSAPVMITLGDEFFGMGYDEMLEVHNKLQPVACSLGVKHVENPRHYGVVVEKDGVITKLIEKPPDPPTDLAIAGVYLIDDTPLFWECMEENMAKVDNEVQVSPKPLYQLTDALELMVQKKAILKTFEVPEWYDCGRPEMLLEVNQILLDEYGSDNSGVMRRCVLIDPVRISKGCKLEDSIIGPHVSVDSGTTIKNSIIKNTIIGSDSEIENIVLKESIISDEVVMQGRGQTVNVGENSEIRML
jgi:glucose-1-phosphate thymidylyltransferase